MSSPFNSTQHDLTAQRVDHLTLVNGRCFSISDRNGEIRFPGDGTIYEDLRMLSKFVVSIVGNSGTDERQRLAVSCPSPFSAVVVTRPDPAAVRQTPTESYIHRQWIGRGVRHDLEIHNTAHDDIERRVTVEIDTDFAHIFDVKSGVASPHDCVLKWNETSGTLIDPVDDTHRVDIATSQAPDIAIGDKSLSWTVQCPALSVAVLSITFEPVWDGVPAGLSYPLDVTPAAALPALRLDQWQRNAPHVVTDDRRLSAAVDTCMSDLASLRIFDPVHPDRTVVAAGAPWFMTLFGRDSLLTSWMMMPFAPELAVGVLRELADLQGTVECPDTEEQPGKIIHELRRRGGDHAFAERGSYYGTVDATPLFVMVAAEARRWGHLAGHQLAALWPHVRAALDWVTARLDANPAGLLTYERSTPTGLVNQGWKDSWDGITFSDGRIPTGPIALSEVQGYAYAALRGGAELARSVADPGVDADHLEREADRLRNRFDDLFWNEPASSYALGVAADGSMIDAVTTNPGHALWAGLADTDRADRYLDRILDDDLWTGWGLRTLSPTCAAYNPLSYHNGSVWPHDTALVAAGAARHGRYDVVDRLVTAALDVAEQRDARPPELFAGIARSVVDTPVDYPDSCSPQAWASASTLLNVRSSLALEPPVGQESSPSVTRLTPGADGLRFDELVGVRYASQRFRMVRDGPTVTLEPVGATP